MFVITIIKLIIKRFKLKPTSLFVFSDLYSLLEAFYWLCFSIFAELLVGMRKCFVVKEERSSQLIKSIKLWQIQDEHMFVRTPLQLFMLLQPLPRAGFRRRMASELFLEVLKLLLCAVEALTTFVCRKNMCSRGPCDGGD